MTTGFGENEFGDGPHGFGDPIGPGQLGFELVEFPYNSSSPSPPADPTYAYDGGELIHLRAAWPVLGPYRIHLLDADGQWWPNPIYARGCYSAKMGKGADCFANLSREILTFTCPRARAGVYSIRVRWSDGAEESTLANALRLVAPAQSRITQTLLEHFGTDGSLRAL